MLTIMKPDNLEKQNHSTDTLVNFKHILQVKSRAIVFL